MSVFTPMTWSRRPKTALWFAGFLELLIGLGMGVTALTQPMLRTLMVPAAILTALGVGFVFWARSASRGYARAQHLRQHGLAGQARILGLSQTGAMMNNQPMVVRQLMVELPDRPPYPVMVKEWVPLIMLGRLSSGLPLPVKVDPADPQAVVIEWESAGMVAPGAGPVATPAASADVKRRLLEAGVAGTVRVVSASPNGQTDAEGRPVFDIVFQVEVPGHAPFSGAARSGVPPDRIARLRPGATVPIKADPAVPQMMAVDWERA